MPVFLFTDIEGSTEKWEKHKPDMEKALSRHDDILKKTIEGHKGRIVSHTGDGVFAVFREDGDPLTCAIKIQDRFAKANWGNLGELRIRMAFHAGEAEERDQNYFGPVINRAARILAAGWGGQILLTSEIKNLCELPQEAAFEDLGVHLLKDLNQPQQIYALLHPDLSIKKFPPLRSLSAHPNNLPVQPTPFVGRKKELEKISRYLQEPSCRLLTLTGPGGTGKTRLALQAAAENIETFSHGAYFVSLAPLSSSEYILSAIADALSFTFYGSGDPEVQLLNYLKEKKMLLVLDNFEHLVEGCMLLSNIIKRAPLVKLLVTSRERLNLQSENLFEVTGMDIPEPNETGEIESSDAIRLFLQNARRLASSFAISENELPHIIRICRLVEGIPLGIELASAWVRTLSCEEIAGEIQKNIDFLSASFRDMPGRHQSLRATFEYSWNLLSDPERTGFSRLSIFRGGFERKAAEKVSGISLPVLSSLVDKSLLTKSSSNRYKMHEMLRQYAEEKLLQIPEGRDKVQKSHSCFYADFLKQREEDLRGANQKKVLEEIWEEIDNVRAAWEWAVEHEDIEKIEKSLVPLFCGFYQLRGLFREGNEAMDLAAKALKEMAKKRESKEKTSRILMKILTQHGNFCERMGLLEEAEKLYGESLSIAQEIGDQWQTATLFNNLSLVVNSLGKQEEAKQFSLKSLSIFKEMGSLCQIAICLLNQGIFSRDLGEYGNAKNLFSESLSIFKEIEDRQYAAHCLLQLGAIEIREGRYGKAERFIQEGHDVLKELGDQRGVTLSLVLLGEVAARMEDYPKAWQLCQESLAISRETGNRKEEVRALESLGNVALEIQEYLKAKQFYQEALDVSVAIRFKLRTAGILNGLGNAEYFIHEYEKSNKHYQEALKTALKIGTTPVILETLTSMARLLACQGRQELACELTALCLDHPAAEKWVKDRASTLFHQLEQQLTKETIDAIKERAKTRKLEEIANDILSNFAGSFADKKG